MLVKVYVGWLYAFAFIPSVFLEECGVPQVNNVSVEHGMVSWAGDYEPSCLHGVQVCWMYPEIKASACTVAPPDASSLRMKGYHPCERIVASVTALGKKHNSKDWPGNGFAGPPEIPELKIKQKSSNVAELSWSSLKKFTCVTGVHLWICENRTDSLKSCLFKDIHPDKVSFEFHGVQICRRYYAMMKTISKYQNDSSALTTLPLFIDSATKVSKMKATNVTQSSAVVRWRVSDANLTCRTEQMRLCYQENSTDTTPDCSSWTLGRRGNIDEFQLTDLQACTAYKVSVDLTTAISSSSRTTTFTTPLHGEAIEAAVVNISDTEAVVRWRLDADKTDCGPDFMEVCHSPAGSYDSASCHSLASAASTTHIRNLAACTSYHVVLTVMTYVTPRPTRRLNLVTSSNGHPVLDHMALQAVDGTVRVRWTPANTSLQCIRLYNVSWYSSGDARKTWRTYPVDSTSCTIYLVSKGQTYYVEVAAIFVDGTTESLFQHVDVPIHSGSPRSLGPQFIVLCMLLIIIESTKKTQI